jgi:hypothetical protein
VDTAEKRWRGRNETDLERCDRNLVELLQEVRVVQTGVQVLFAFLLMAPLTPVFQKLGSLQQAEYFVTLLFAAAGAVLLIAPTAYHRLLFRRGDKEYLVVVANRLTIVGLAAVGLSMVGALVFVSDILFDRWAVILVGALALTICSILWAFLPLLRRRALEKAEQSGGSAVEEHGPGRSAAEERVRSSARTPAASLAERG